MPPDGTLDSAREAAIARLSDAFAQDALTLDELERRLSAVYAAGDRAALHALLADLPSPAVVRADATRGTRRSPTDPDEPHERVSAVLSNVERTVFEVPARLEVRATFANVELDLRGARFGPGVTEISVRAVLGNIEIRLPDGVAVDNRGGGVLGSFECRTPSRVAAHAPMVRIVGRAVLGAVTIVSATDELANPPHPARDLAPGQHRALSAPDRHP